MNNTEKNFVDRTHNNCWVCEGWNQVHFIIYLPDRYHNLDIKNLWIHLSFENWRPVLMQMKKKFPFADESSDLSNKSLDSDSLKSSNQSVDQREFDLLRMVPTT